MFPNERKAQNKKCKKKAKNVREKSQKLSNKNINNESPFSSPSDLIHGREHDVENKKIQN